MTTVCESCGMPTPGEGESVLVVARGSHGVAVRDGVTLIEVPNHYDGDFEVNAIGTITAIFDRLDDDESRGRVARYLAFRYAPRGEG